MPTFSTILQIITTVAVFYLILVGAMYVFQRNFLYHPENFTPSPKQSGVSEMQEIHIQTEDGLSLLSWAKAPRDANKPWIVIFHGNAGTLGSRGFKARAFLDAGYGVMLAEYRGYSGNKGQPSEAGFMMDARAALAYVADQGGTGAKLVLYGESIGTGVAVTMAVEAAGQGQAVASVILEAPFTTAADAGASHYPFIPVRSLMKDRFDSLSKIQSINAPLFLVHGTHDWVVPFALGQKLFAQALEPKQSLWVENGGHSDLFVPDVTKAMIAFLEKSTAQ